MAQISRFPLSYYGDQENQLPFDPRPIPKVMALVVLEHMRNAPEGNVEWATLVRKYPELVHPALSYSYIPSEEMAESIVRDLCHSIDLRYGCGRRMHTFAEVGEIGMVKQVIRLQVYGSIGGFNRVQANSTNVNQQIQNRTLEPAHRSPLARLPVVGRLFKS